MAIPLRQPVTALMKRAGGFCSGTGWSPGVFSSHLMSGLWHRVPDGHNHIPWPLLRLQHRSCFRRSKPLQLPGPAPGPWNQPSKLKHDPALSTTKPGRILRGHWQ